MKITKLINKINQRKIKNSNDAVVGIVVAVLLVGLLVTFMSIIQVYYVPKWMKEKEADHMNEVSNQFSQFKFAIDTQVALNRSDIPITTPFTLGSTELPFFMSMPAYGQLDIIDNACNISFYDDTDSLVKYYNLGMVRFSSINAYLEDQSFIYESGAIINSQSEGNIFAVKPFFKVNSTTPFEIIFKLIDISSVGGKTTSQTSTDSTAIQTEFSDYSSNHTFPLDYFYIYTPYSNAWGLFLNSSLKNSGLTYGSYYVNTTSTQVKVDFVNIFPSIKIEKYNIQAQIGPGWIEK